MGLGGGSGCGPGVGGLARALAAGWFQRARRRMLRLPLPVLSDAGPPVTSAALPGGPTRIALETFLGWPHCACALPGCFAAGMTCHGMLFLVFPAALHYIGSVLVHGAKRVAPSYSEQAQLDGIHTGVLVPRRWRRAGASV